ncbi:MAG: bestrophin family ion channel [Microcoleus sp.]
MAKSLIADKDPEAIESILRNIENLSIDISQFPRGKRANNIEIAITGYQIVLSDRQPGSEKFAQTQYNLANAYSDRINGSRADNLERAIGFYEAALTVYTLEDFPEDWAMTQNGLANAYSNRINGSRADNLQSAIGFYEAALTVYTFEDFPLENVLTLNNLGRADLAKLDHINLEKPEDIKQRAATINSGYDTFKDAIVRKSMTTNIEPWFKIAFQLRGSLIPQIMPLVILCSGFGLILSILYDRGLPVAFSTGSIIPSIVLGLLLVFRTNTAYERFWEGRKLWGLLVNSNRNLARQIWVNVDEKEPNDFLEKQETLRLLAAFAVALKLHLRQEPINEELAELISSEQYEKLKNMNLPPIEISFWIGDYLNRQWNRGCLDIHQLTGMEQLINNLIDVLGGCERILRTPIPLAYSIHLKHLLLLYCLLLPFEIVHDFGWGLAPVMGIISFTLFGIEIIGITIENPFSRNVNNLPLDTICNTIKRNINDLISLDPSVHSHVK